MKALAIGISNAPRLDYLAGAVNGARAFHEWASASGYEARLLIDDEEPVTIPRLQKELLELLKGSPFKRLLIYYAGHGLIRELEEGLWLLSDWDAALRAVAVEVLKRRLFQYGISQIGIFADACRSLPSDIQAADLTPDAVLGRGPIASTTAPVDKFIAAQDGAQTFMIPGANPEDDRCLFSGVLLEALWGTKPGAFSKLPTLTDKVTSRSLGTFVQAEVSQLATGYGFKITPTIVPTFPEMEDVYFSLKQGLKAPAFPGWPPPSDLVRIRTASQRAGIGPAPRQAERGGNKEPPLEIPKQTSAIGKQLREQNRPSGFETGSGFAIEGEKVVALWTSDDVVAEVHRERNWWRVRQKLDSCLCYPAPVLIEFANGHFAAIVALPQFIASLLVKPGVSAVIFREAYSPQDSAAFAEAAIERMEQGGLRGDSANDLAVQLRNGKHADPVLGVLSAYLYDSIGDVDSIRSMAYFYAARDQPIPYDIALLGQLPGCRRDGLLYATVPEVKERTPRTEVERDYSWSYHATPKAEGVVAGLCPWLRQGWTYLDDPADDGPSLILPEILELKPFLTNSRFTTFDAIGGDRATRLFGLLARRSAPL